MGWIILGAVLAWDTWRHIRRRRTAKRIRGLWEKRNGK